MSEAKAVSLKCPSCGAPLQIGGTVEHVACSYCGGGVQVERGGGVVSLHLLNDTMRSVQRGTDKTAAELAILRLTIELRECDEEERRVTALQAESENRWDAHFAKLRARDRTKPVVLVGLVVLVSFAGLAQSAPDSFRSMATALAVVAAIALTSYIWLTIGKGFRRALAEDNARKETADASHNALVGDAHTKTAKVRARLDAQRRLVD